MVSHPKINHVRAESPKSYIWPQWCKRYDNEKYVVIPHQLIRGEDKHIVGCNKSYAQQLRTLVRKDGCDIKILNNLNKDERTYTRYKRSIKKLDHFFISFEISIKFSSGSRMQTDRIELVAPVQTTGPSSIGIAKFLRCVTTSSKGSFAMKQRSADPGIGTFALGSNSLPASCKFIFWFPKVKAFRFSSNEVIPKPSTRS